MSDTAKKDVLMYVTKYGFEYVLSAKMYWFSQFGPARRNIITYAGEEIRTRP
jgi:hypothetical protein